MFRTSLKIDGVQVSNHELSSLRLSQEVGTHHTFEVRFHYDFALPNLNELSKKYIGSSVTIGLGDTAESDIDSANIPDFFKGVVTGVRVASSQGAMNLVIEGKSRTIHCDDGPNTQSFADMGVQEIVDKVTGSYKAQFPKGITVSPRFSKTLPYTVQYQESNFNFLCRLAARYGDWLYYDGFKLVYGEHISSSPITLDFDENGLTSFELKLQAMPVTGEVAGYDFRENKILKENNPKKVKLGDMGQAALKKGESDLFTKNQLITTGHQEATQDFLKDVARRNEEIATEEVAVFYGTSVNGKLKVGSVIKLSNTGATDGLGNYIITRVNHRVEQGGGYSNEFEAIPEEMDAPMLTYSPTPPFCEAQIATVADTADPEGKGRIRVQFIWSKNSGVDSPWIRVMSPYAGKASGFYMVPDIDDTVMVGFENNDPDRPYMMGAMYHGQANFEDFDPDNLKKSIRTTAENRLTFDEKEEAMEMYAKKKITLHAEKEFEFKTDGSAGSKMTIDVGQGTLIIKAGEVKIETKKKTAIDSKGDVEIKSAKSTKVDALEASITAKAKFSAESKGAAELKGSMVNVDSKGPAVVKGMPIKLN